ncbi:hypothetical protein [Paenibacillus montaniterrae]|uniref:hypothetical protein n=1 Tax=Paenibacillus montaniterrae TaxID=429341 RepID=UPI001BCD0795|nr:hypothetical protein [Paenibacillus montaniterrae]
MHRHQSRSFEQPLQSRFKKLGFQDQEAWTLVENEERSVEKSYVSTGIFASVQDSPSTTLQRNRIVIKVMLFKLPLPIEVQNFGFQDQEDGTILEGEERSVGKSYVSTGAFGSVTYSPSNTLQRNHIVIKVGVLNNLFNRGLKSLAFRTKKLGR